MRRSPLARCPSAVPRAAAKPVLADFDAWRNVVAVHAHVRRALSTKRDDAHIFRGRLDALSQLIATADSPSTSWTTALAIASAAVQESRLHQTATADGPSDTDEIAAATVACARAAVRVAAMGGRWDLALHSIAINSGDAGVGGGQASLLGLPASLAVDVAQALCDASPHHESWEGAWPVVVPLAAPFMLETQARAVCRGDAARHYDSWWVALHLSAGLSAARNFNRAYAPPLPIALATAFVHHGRDADARELLVRVRGSRINDARRRHVEGICVGVGMQLRTRVPPARAPAVPPEVGARGATAPPLAPAAPKREPSLSEPGIVDAIARSLAASGGRWESAVQVIVSAFDGGGGADQGPTRRLVPGGKQAQPLCDSLDWRLASSLLRHLSSSKDSWAMGLRGFAWIKSQTPLHSCREGSLPRHDAVNPPPQPSVSVLGALRMCWHGRAPAAVQWAAPLYRSAQRSGRPESGFERGLLDSMRRDAVENAVQSPLVLASLGDSAGGGLHTVAWDTALRGLARARARDELAAWCSSRPQHAAALLAWVDPADGVAVDALFDQQTTS